MIGKKNLSVGLVSCVIILHLALQSLPYSAGVLPLNGDKLYFVYVAKLSIPEVFQTSAQLHSGSSVSCATDQSPVQRQPPPPPAC